MLLGRRVDARLKAVQEEVNILFSEVDQSDDGAIQYDGTVAYIK